MLTMRWVPTLLLGIVLSTNVAHAAPTWPAYDEKHGPGGLATIVLVHPRHGSRIHGPNLTIRLRSDNPRAAIRVRLDGRFVDRNGEPHTPLPSNPSDSPQWSFREVDGPEMLVPVRGLEPGLHSLEIIRGGSGTELPDTNEQRVTFIAEP